MVLMDFLNKISIPCLGSLSGIMCSNSDSWLSVHQKLFIAVYSLHLSLLTAISIAVCYAVFNSLSFATVIMSTWHPVHISFL